MIDALVAGRLYGKAQSRTAKNGSTFAVATVRVPTRQADVVVFMSVICFSESGVRALLALGDTDAVALAGELTPKVYVDKHGEARPALDLLAHAVLTEYHITRKRQAVKAAKTVTGPEPEAPRAEQQPAQADADFNDDIPF